MDKTSTAIVDIVWNAWQENLVAFKQDLLDDKNVSKPFKETSLKDPGRRCWQEGWEADPRDEALARGLVEIHGHSASFHLRVKM